MRNLQKLLPLLVLAFGSLCSADTFVNVKTKEVLHGYATSHTRGTSIIVVTQEKGRVELDPVEWEVTADRLGRNNTIRVLTIDDKIMLRIQTEALVKAIAEAVDKGPLFIIVEIDTPGGRIDYTRTICGALSRTNGCPVIAFVKGGTYGGAISAGAAVALACDKIYMAEETTIGAAATVGLAKNKVRSFKEIYGEQIAEKINSAWRTYLASLAEQNNRPGLLAGAMVDENIEVVEVVDNRRRLFVDPADRRPEQQIVHTWSKKGSLLTLTAEEAVSCGIADGVVTSRADLFRRLDATDARIVEDRAFQRAGLQFRRAKTRFAKLSTSLDLKIKQMKLAPTEVRALKLLRDIRDDYKSLLSLAKHYPDLQIDVGHLEQQLNSAEALYEQYKMRRYRVR